MQRNRKIPNKKEQEKGRRKSAKVNKKIRGNRRKQEGMTEETFFRVVHGCCSHYKEWSGIRSIIYVASVLTAIRASAKFTNW